MKTTTLLFACLLIGTAAHAQDTRSVKGEGDVVKKTLAVDAFHGIILEGAANVEITQSATQQVVVEAQPNIAALVTTNVTNGIWTIGTGKASYSTNKPFIVHISVPMIDKVRIEGSGDVTGHGKFTADAVDVVIEGSGNISMQFAAKSIRADVQGSGNIDLGGECTSLKASVEGSGDINATNLASSEAVADIEGSGNIDLSARESLSAEVAGSGNVSYKGKPGHVHKEVSGSGTVRAVD